MYAAIRSYLYFLPGVPGSQRTALAPGTRISLHLPVFLTCTFSGSPPTSTSATNLLGLRTNSAPMVLP